MAHFEKQFLKEVVPKFQALLRTSLKNLSIDFPAFLQNVGLFHETGEFNVKEYKFDSGSNKEGKFDDEDEIVFFREEDDELSKRLSLITFLNTLAELMNIDLDFPYIGANDEDFLNAPREVILTPDELKDKVPNLDSIGTLNRFLVAQYGLESRLLKLLRFTEESTLNIFSGVLRAMCAERFGVRMREVPGQSTILIKKTVIPTDTYVILHRRTEEVTDSRDENRVLFTFTWEISLTFSTKKLDELETIYCQIRKLRVAKKDEEFAKRFRRFFGEPMWNRERNLVHKKIMEAEDISCKRVAGLAAAFVVGVVLIRVLVALYKMLSYECVECV